MLHNLRAPPPTAIDDVVRDDGTLHIVNAGHCPPLIVRNDGRLDPIPSTGPVVGVLASATWQTATLTLAPGEHLLLYTDRVTEATALDDDDEFGRHGIERALRSAPRRSAQTRSRRPCSTRCSGTRVAS